VLVYREAVQRAVEIVYGTGTVIDRMAHAHNRHGGPFEACRRCNPSSALLPSIRGS